MERLRTRKCDAGKAGPPAAGPVVNKHWEDGSNVRSRPCVNDGVRPNSSERSAPDVARTKLIGRSIKIATWNVRTLYMPGKLDNLVNEAKSLSTDILGISETHYTDEGYIRKDDYIFISSGGEEHARGVGFLIKKSLEPSILGYWCVSDRIILLRIKGQPFDISIIQAYAPTTTHDDNEVEEFYNALDLAIKQTKSTDIIFVMGDFNAKVGCNSYNKITGNFGLGERNERGERLLQFCEENNLVITNTLFEHPLRRRYTWKQPGDGHRNQIDYILIKDRFRNCIKQARAYPGADIGSDHNPVVTKCRLKIKKIGCTKTSPKINIAALKGDITIEYNIAFKNKYSTLAEELDEQSVEGQWSILKKSLEAANAKIPKSKPTGKQSWMTNNILVKMEERKAAKNNKEKYQALDKEVQKLCTKAKEDWINERCAEIEELEAKHYSREMHTLAKEISGKSRRNSKTGCIKSKDGSLLFEKEQILSRWEEYVNELFEDSRPDKPEILNNDGPEITYHEVKQALCQTQNNKAAGPDNIRAEMLKALDAFGVKKLTTLCNLIYESGEIPDDLLQSVFITLPKKPKASECGDFRTISLMSHVTKLILKIILNRNQQRLSDEAGLFQFGFKKDSGTREAIFCMRTIIEKALEKGKDVYACFIDYAKAFDRVHHLQLIDCLKDINMDGKDLRFITNLYWQQTASIRVDKDVSNPTCIRRGVRQGCVASPSLFSLYTECIFKEIQDMKGIAIGGHNINNLRYADDTVLLAENEQDLQHLLDKIKDKSTEFGLDMNIKKTKTMVISKKSAIPLVNIYVNNDRLEQVKNFKYLGQTIFDDGKCLDEIKQRIGIAKARFHAMSKVLKSRKISITTRMRLVRCYVYSALCYGCETWDINKLAANKINAFEMYIFRRLLRIKWTDHISNVKVLNTMNSKRNLLLSIQKRKLKYFGHITRGNNILTTLFQGEVPGKRTPGRQRRMWSDNIKEWTGWSLYECTSRARDRVGWRSTVCHLRTGDAT